MNEFFFIVKEELEGLIEKIFNKKLYRRNVFCQIEFDKNLKMKYYLDKVECSFKKDILPYLEEYLHKKIKNIDFSDFMGEQGFVFSF